MNAVFTPACVRAGASALLVNGALVDLANFDLYAFLDMLRKEVRVAQPLEPQQPPSYPPPPSPTPPLISPSR